MTNDYDLVVIGSSPEVILAAVTAASFKARVALVEQPYQKGFDAIYSRTFSHVAHLSEQLETARELGAYQPIPHLEIQLPQVRSWAQEVSAILSEQSSPAILASLGIDTIKGSGEFCRLPRQAFIVGDRKLRSRNYLIATGSHLVTHNFDEVETVGYLTPSDLLQPNKLASLPFNLVIIGNSPLAIELAQNLSKAGRNITLIVEDKYLLPTEDIEAARLIQAKLEADGVKILIESSVTQVRRIEEKKWLQAADRAIETDEILLVGRRQPNIEGLNLEGVGVRVNHWGIQLNEKLQTTNPRIYACGSVAGGYEGLTHLVRFEANIAVKNALFLPLFTVDYRTIPYLIFTNPPLARVGMTEDRARKRYGKDVWVVKQNFKAIAQAQVLGETTGFCKLIVRGNGEILGAHIMGAEAGELISAIALAMKNKIKLGSIVSTPFPSLTLSEMFQEIAFEWQRQRLKQNKNLQDFLENLFICLRNFSS
jgi:pyruvate/2-oxoglutarate dehydrogenase complex dihydrolipoamide dehydrogenase (E3) component